MDMKKRIEFMSYAICIRMGRYGYGSGMGMGMGGMYHIIWELLEAGFGVGSLLVLFGVCRGI